MTLIPNTFNISVSTDNYNSYNTIDELRQLLRQNVNHQQILNIGVGSNLLFTTPIFNGFVLHNNIHDLTILDDYDDDRIHLLVGGGWIMDDFVKFTLDNEWYGLENLSWIPGTVGASAIQNIGAYGTEIQEFIYAVHCLDANNLNERIFTHDQCEYAYRDSYFKHHREWIVTHVHYAIPLSKTFIPRTTYGGLAQQLLPWVTANEVRDVIINTRKQKLPNPKLYGNAGSFFMNPIVEQSVYEDIATRYSNVPHYLAIEGHVKLSAAWLIEQSGWKGRALGPASVSSQHALILINTGGATGKDIVNLCHAVQHAVKENFGIQLHPEVNFI